MNISILSVFSSLYDPFIQTSLIKRAQESKIINCSVDNFFSFVAPKERIDSPTFGHGSGMLLKPEVMQKGIEAQEAKYGLAFKIFFSPHGKKLTQSLLKDIYQRAQEKKHVLLVAGRYEGMDARVEEYYADEIISVGDFVLMGGDVPALTFLEGFLRLIPGVVGKQESVEKESFSGPFVDYPEYTEPVEWQGMKVPEVIRSGNHAAMHDWRMQQAVKRTVVGHFDWLRSYSPLSAQEKKMVASVMPTHYVALLHEQVILGDGDRIGTTSVTSLDLHDIARSSKTYGIKQFFIVTPLIDQQKIVQKLLDFWQTGVGVEYNASRHEAVKSVEVLAQLADVQEEITKKEGKAPIVIATSARSLDHKEHITFYDQAKVWQQGRPILFIFGTGKGLAPELIEKCDYLLTPVEGFSDYNHLSVRSATAIVLDRWLGINIRSPR